MKGSNLVLMTIAVVAVGIIAMPSTISLFAGQHAWYNISGEGNEVPCVKCHADVYEEFKQSDVHKTLAEGSGAKSWDFGTDYEVNKACGACHRAAYEELGKITYAEGDGEAATPGVQAHAASTVACMACHQVEGNYTNAPPAGGFEDPYNNSSGLGITDGMTADPVTGFNFSYNSSDYPGGHAAHQGFIEGAIAFERMEDSNEACIACHTHVPVKISWKHAYSLEFNATYDPSLLLPPTHFNTSNYDTNGTILVISYGNHSGESKVGSWPEGNVSIWDGK